jgi:hypothetical protein
MLPDFRFVIGATLATAVLGVAAFGLATAVRLSHQTKIGPLESSRSLAFDERADWNQFSDPELMRRFEDLARQVDAAGATPEVDVAAANMPQPAVSSPGLETPERNEPPAVVTPDDADAAVIREQATRADLEPSLESEPSTPAVALAPQASTPGADGSMAPNNFTPQEATVTGSVATAAPAPQVPTARAISPIESVETPAPVTAIAAPANAEAPPVEPPSAAEHVAIPAAMPTDAAAVEPIALPPKAAPVPRQIANAAPNVKLPVAKPAAKAKAKPKIVAKKVRRARPRAAATPPPARSNDPFGGFFPN